MSVFANVPLGPPIEVFKLNKQYLDDPFPKKVNLTIGAYRTDEGKPWVLPIVRKVEKILAEDNSLNHEYLPVLGLDVFATAATKMLLGADSKPFLEERAFGVQSLSGTGALSIGANFLKSQMNRNVVYVSTPSWENHNLLLKHAGFGEIRSYRYWNGAKKCLDFDGMCEDLKNAPVDSVIILHACAHNPTGSDPSRDQWKILASIIKDKKLFPFFDCAYQGFASGCLETDAWAVRYFANEGLEMFCAQSFAKNFGLYNERVGNLTVIVRDKECIPAVKSQLTLIVRAIYSNPPCHGARIVSAVLNIQEYFEQWQACIQLMALRIRKMREGLRGKLEEKTGVDTWKHITDQIGMFSYTGLTEPQVTYLKERHHIYLLPSGRINMCGLNTNNLDYVVECFLDAIENVKVVDSFAKNGKL